TVSPQTLTLKPNTKPLNHLQKLLGTINLVWPILGMTTQQLKHLFNLLKGDSDLNSP
ncbi:POK25 protein, partial [Zapornia atra]|nr:POK25 protein [Zapornia atra]